MSDHNKKIAFPTSFPTSRSTELGGWKEGRLESASTVDDATPARRPSRAARVRLHRMRARVIYAMPPGPSPDRTRLWREILGAEGALVKMIVRRERPDEPNLVAAASLLDQYRGVRRLERCLERMGATDSRALVVTESPNDGRERALDGPSDRRLAYLLGLSDGEHLDDLVECANLLTDDEIKVGATMDLIRARVAALPTRRRVVIVCGRTAAAGFGLEDAHFFEWREVGRAAVAVIPHPSGRNRWWDDEENIILAERFLGGVGRRLRSSSQIDGIDGDRAACSKGEVSRTIRTTVPEDVGEAIDRLCEETAITPAVWMRALAIREIRALGSMRGGEIYGCVCGHLRSEHRLTRDHEGDFYGACVECSAKKCASYQQAPPPQKKVGSS